MLFCGSCSTSYPRRCSLHCKTSLPFARGRSPPLLLHQKNGMPVLFSKSFGRTWKNQKAHMYQLMMLINQTRSGGRNIGCRHNFFLKKRPSSPPRKFFLQKKLSAVSDASRQKTDYRSQKAVFIPRQWRAVTEISFSVFMQTHSLPRLSPPETPDSFTGEASGVGCFFSG